MFMSYFGISFILIGVLVEMNKASVSTSAENVRHYEHTVPRAEWHVQHPKSGGDHQPSPIVHFSQTQNLTKSLAVSLYVIEKNSGTEEAEDILLIHRDIEFHEKNLFKR